MKKIEETDIRTSDLEDKEQKDTLNQFEARVMMALAKNGYVETTKEIIEHFNGQGSSVKKFWYKNVPCYLVGCKEEVDLAENVSQEDRVHPKHLVTNADAI